MKKTLTTFYVLTIILGLIEVFTCQVQSWNWHIISGIELVILGFMGAIRENED